MAERAGVRVPGVDRVIKAGDGTALLVMDRVDGSSLDQLPAQRISDDAAPAAVGRGGQAAPGRDRPPVAAGGQRDGRRRRAALARSTSASPSWPPRQRQMDLDVAELLASLAVLVGADRAVSSRRRGHRRPGSGGRGAAAAAAGPVGRHPPRDRAARRPARPGPGSAAAAASGQRGQPNWPACSGYGPGPCWRSPPPPARSTSCFPSWPRWAAAGTPSSRRTGPGCPSSSPCRR